VAYFPGVLQVRQLILAVQKSKLLEAAEAELFEGCPSCHRTNRVKSTEG